MLEDRTTAARYSQVVVDALFAKFDPAGRTIEQAAADYRRMVADNVRRSDPARLTKPAIHRQSVPSLNGAVTRCSQLPGYQNLPQV